MIKENKMNEVKIEKVVLNVGGTGEYLDKGHKLLEFLTGKKPAKMASRKRIPTWSVRPGLEIGTVVTLRKDYEELLRKILATIDNTIKKKSLSENNLSFGIKEYIEIPGIEYQREIGIMGFDVTIVFKNSGRRVRLKKVKRGKVPKRKMVSREEIIKFMGENFNTKFI